jgi:hypothetical protein
VRPPSKDVLEQVSLLISIVSGVLKLLPLKFQRLSFLAHGWARRALSAVALCSLGFYLGYLNYVRGWALTNHVEGELYNFDVTQAPGQTWCQWMMDAQDPTALKNQGLVVVPLRLGDFLYIGKEPRPRVGFLSAQDKVHPEEPPGKTGVGIFDYRIKERFSKLSTVKLTLRIGRRTLDIPPRIEILVNDFRVGRIKLDDCSTECSTDPFASKILSNAGNYIYLEPAFDEAPSGNSKLAYLESVQIANK